MAETTINPLEEMEKYLAEMDKSLADMDKYLVEEEEYLCDAKVRVDDFLRWLAEEFVLEETDSEDDFLRWKEDFLRDAKVRKEKIKWEEDLISEEDFLRDEKARKEKVKVSGGFFLVLASYGKQEFEWWDYYACQKAAEDDVKERVDRMREYDHTPLQAEKLEWVVEPY